MKCILIKPYKNSALPPEVWKIGKSHQSKRHASGFALSIASPQVPTGAASRIWFSDAKKIQRQETLAPTASE